MKNITKAVIVAGIVAAVGLVSAPTQAYFYQPQSYGYGQQAYQHYSNPYNYGYQDNVRQLVQENLNFVNSFRYIPRPVHMYFYNYYPPYNYGWGY